MSTISPGTSSLLLDAVERRALLRAWTLEEYHEAIRNRSIGESPAYELLDGWIVRKIRNKAGESQMTIGDRHRVSIVRLTDFAPKFKRHGCFLQSQQPIALPPRHEPEPDTSIIRGTVDDYVNGPPGPAEVLCVIEVADASLRRDRVVKLKIYAAARIPMYVIVNLVDDQIEVYRLGKKGYGKPRLLKAGETLSLPTATGASVDVAVERLLP